jgi:S-adenosylmethionine hydrolase
MPIVTLTTDWGLRDHYVAAFKGDLISRYPEIQLVDVSHQVEHFDILQASFIIRNCFEKFPKGTLHFIGISGNITRNDKNGKRNFLIVKSGGHFFAGEDSGIFSLILGDAEKEIFRLPIAHDAPSSEVHELFLSVITSFAKGKNAEEIGQPSDELVRSFHTQPTVDQSGIRGAVIYVDEFGNIISNITKELFEKVREGRKFTIFLRRTEYDVHRISKNYFDSEAGEIVALFNREGYLKLSINRDKAGGLLGMKMMDPIRIEFM